MLSLSFLNNSSFPLIFSLPSSFLCRHSQPPILCPASCLSRFSFYPGSQLVICLVEGQTGRCQCRIVGSWRFVHRNLRGCTSQADFVPNFSPKCTQKTIVRLKGVKSITGRDGEMQTFRVSAGFSEPYLKSFLMLPGREA